MENKKLNKHRIALLALVRKWKINQEMLAKNIGMASGTFKNKFIETGDKYSFTDDEFLQLAATIDKMMQDLSKFGDQVIPEESYIL